MRIFAGVLKAEWVEFNRSIRKVRDREYMGREQGMGPALL